MAVAMAVARFMRCASRHNAAITGLVLVLVMRIMGVFMRVCQHHVMVFVRMVFCQMQPHTEPHQTACG